VRGKGGGEERRREAGGMVQGRKREVVETQRNFDRMKFFEISVGICFFGLTSSTEQKRYSCAEFHSPHE